jgi:ABC-type uncharacterized transport system substrate-binding protein
MVLKEMWLNNKVASNLGIGLTKDILKEAGKIIECRKEDPNVN